MMCMYVYIERKTRSLSYNSMYVCKYVPYVCINVCMYVCMYYNHVVGCGQVRASGQYRASISCGGDAVGLQGPEGQACVTLLHLLRLLRAGIHIPYYYYFYSHISMCMCMYKPSIRLRFR